MVKREFVLTNGIKFIKQDLDGKYRQTTNLSLADSWDSYKVAEAILLNSIPKALSASYYVAEIVGSDIVPQSKVVACQEKKRTGDVVKFNNDFKDSEWSQKFDGLDILFEKASKSMYGLSQAVQDTDLEISDVIHYIEFNQLNAREGYKIYKKLNELLCKRRNLKFEQKIVASINKNYKAVEYINNILKTIKECQNDVYKPRILSELFKKEC